MIGRRCPVMGRRRGWKNQRGTPMPRLSSQSGGNINIDFGTLGHEVASALADDLSHHTAKPDKCYFAV